MKKINITLSIILSLSFIFNTIFAQTILACESRNTDLTEQEEEYLSEIYDIDPNFTWDGTLVGITKTSGNFESATSDELNSRLSSSDMSIYVTYSIRSKAVTDLLDVNVYATWNVNPYTNLTDYLGLAWTGGLTVTNKTCTAVYENGTAVSCTLAESATNTGVAYSFKTYQGFVTNKISYVRLYTRLYRSTHVSDIVGLSTKYAHFNTSASSVTIELQNTPAVLYYSSATFETLVASNYADMS